MPGSTYKCRAGEAEIQALYDEALDSLALGYESLTVGTRAGDTLRARQLFPNLVHARCLWGCRHVPGRTALDGVNDYLRAFLTRPDLAQRTCVADAARADRGAPSWRLKHLSRFSGQNRPEVRPADGPPSTGTSRCGPLRSAKLYFHERWRQKHIWAVVGRKVRNLTSRGLRTPQRLHSLRHPSCSLRHTWLRRPREDAGGAGDDLG